MRTPARRREIVERMCATFLPHQHEEAQRKPAFTWYGTVTYAYMSNVLDVTEAELHKDLVAALTPAAEAPGPKRCGVVLYADDPAARYGGSIKTPCAGAAQAPHLCPYKTEVKKDDQTTCTCCTACTQQCREDI